ncbi:retrovirus-related pol polyprotein from transposon TNT 1-94 [Tanacetum coccineum]|uniref:Retrovirus-related pol polyprotein from transposon TNT 1-94 n=1 Tax=Tanacetum coccineum TaxID=301880 RepID=A0ABQ5HQS5_9ASTR
MQKHKVAKSAKQKVKSEWKPTEWIFKTIGLKWTPTGRTFNLVGKPCPLSSSNDTSAIVVPPGHILTNTVIPVDVPYAKLSLRYAHAQESLFKCMIVENFLSYLDSGCSKHMTGHRDKLINFVSKFIGMVRFRNDHFAAIMGYGDLQIGNILISRVYYIEGPGHNLFSVGQFCDSDLEVAFKKHTCFVCNLEGVDRLSGSRGSKIYTISMADMMKSSPICQLSKASKTKSWLWHRRLSHLNFGTINKLAKQGLVKGLPKLKYTKDHLCLACQMGKSKKESHPHKPKPSTNEKLQMLHMDLCGPMQDIGKLQPKANIRIFYSPSNKAYQIYNKRTGQIMETMNLQFDELTQIASEQLSSRTELHDLLLQPMFDEYFKPPSVVSTPISPATLLSPDTAGASSSSSTSIDKDAPSPTKAKPKNYKEAMEESCWIEAIQEEIHEFERLEV